VAPASDPILVWFRTVVEAGLAALESRREEVHDLHVFSVAAGDTGDNMVRTLRAVLQELDRLAPATGQRATGQLCRSLGVPLPILTGARLAPEDPQLPSPTAAGISAQSAAAPPAELRSRVGPLGGASAATPATGLATTGAASSATSVSSVNVASAARAMAAARWSMGCRHSHRRPRHCIWGRLADLSACQAS